MLAYSLPPPLYGKRYNVYAMEFAVYGKRQRVSQSENTSQVTDTISFWEPEIESFSRFCPIHLLAWSKMGKELIPERQERTTNDNDSTL